MISCVESEEVDFLNEKMASREDNVMSNQVELAKEFSLLMGEVLRNKENRKDLASFIENLDSFGDAVTLSAILGDEKRMAQLESQSLRVLENDINFRKTKGQFKESLISYSLANLKEYELIESSFKKFNEAFLRENANMSLSESLVEYYSSQGLVVHIPYAERFDWELYEYGITMTYDPVIRDDWNEGYLYEENGEPRRLEYVDDSYSYENPTYVITYYHPDDFLAAPPIPTLPTPAADAVILSYNVNHTSISQADILLSNIPEIKMTDTDYIGLFGTKVKLQLYRGSNKLKVNFDGTVGNSADGESFIYSEYHFSKDDIREERWKTVNIQFDPDWDMSENSQQILVFTKHHISAKGKGSVSAKVGYDFIAKKPTAEATGSVDISVELNSSKFRINSELSRRSVLAHIVGDTGHGVRYRNGIPYNIKASGLVHFYFEHYFTDIPD